MNKENESNSLPPSAQMMKILTGGGYVQALHVVAKLGIADLIKDEAKSISDLAKDTGAHEKSLYRVLKLLASIGVFVEEENGKFGLTPLSSILRTDVPGSVRDAAILIGSNFHWNSWGNLTHSVMTGEPAFEYLHNSTFFDYMIKHPEEASSFNAWMSKASAIQIPAILNSYDFSIFNKIVDVGGGHGILLANILKSNNSVKGILFDLPKVVENANYINEVKDRCEIIGGDFFESVPQGGDAYILKTVIHDWNNDLSVKILSNCRKSISDNGKLILIEIALPSGNEPHPGKWMDVNMLVLNHGGMERTPEEYTKLFEASGFELTRIIPTASPVSIIEGIPKK